MRPRFNPRWPFPPVVVPAGEIRRFAGFGGAQREGQRFPLPSGAPGNPVSPYNEREVWGGPAGDTVTAPVDPGSIGAGPGPGAGVSSADGLSIPFGQSYVDWTNPSTWQQVPLLATTPTNVPVLSLNLLRNALLIQNGSVAVTPDVAPILYVGFNSPPNIGFALALAPAPSSAAAPAGGVGAAVVFDIICPRDSIYVAFGPSAGASVVVRGTVAQSTWIKKSA